jgi:cytochrome b561
MTSFRYAAGQMAVHWLAAAVVLFLLLTGTLVLEDTPNTAHLWPCVTALRTGSAR